MNSILRLGEQSSSAHEPNMTMPGTFDSACCSAQNSQANGIFLYFVFAFFNNVIRMSHIDTRSRETRFRVKFLSFFFLAAHFFSRRRRRSANVVFWLYCKFEIGVVCYHGNLFLLSLSPLVCSTWPFKLAKKKEHFHSLFHDKCKKRQRTTSQRCDIAKYQKISYVYSFFSICIFSQARAAHIHFSFIM